MTKVQSFYDPGLPFLVSDDNHTTYAIVTMKGSENFLQTETPSIRKLANAPPLLTQLVGQSAVNYDVQKASAEDLVKVERFTLPIVALLLILVFGSVIAASVPLVMGIVTVAAALSVVYLLALASDVSIFALNIGTMIGLGLAIDFSLIMVSRFREELRAAPLEAALERTLQTAGRSITFSGITLALTMGVLALFPVMVIRSVAVAIMIVAATAIVTGLLLLPVVLVLLHRYLDRWNLRAKLGFRGSGTGWKTTIARVMRSPWASIGIAITVLALMMAPAGWLKVRGVTVDVLPDSTESRQAVDKVRQDFGQGELSPIFVVVQAPTKGGIWTPKVLDGILAIHERMKHDPRVDHVQSLATLVPNPSKEYMEGLSPATILTSPDRTRIAKEVSTLHGEQRTTVIIVYSKTGATSHDTQQLMLGLRDHAKQWAPGLAGMNVLVGGEPAQHHDFIQVVYDEFPLLLVLSLLVTFVVLMLFFHSLILPLVAIVMNIISLVVSLGLLVVVFQWGIGDNLLGFHSLGALRGVHARAALLRAVRPLDRLPGLPAHARARAGPAGEVERRGDRGGARADRGNDHGGRADHDRRLRVVRVHGRARDQGDRLRARSCGRGRRDARPHRARAGDDEAARPLELVDAEGARPRDPRDRRGRPRGAGRGSPGVASGRGKHLVASA